MALTIDELITPATADDFKAKILAVCTSLGLKTTAWQSGGITRTIIAGFSVVLNLQDKVFSTFAHGGFLKFAAAVTDDPSVARSDGTFPPAGVGFLDIVADSVYNVQRVGPTFGATTVNLLNGSAASYGPFAVGSYHLADPTTKKTFSNSTVLTIAAGPGVTTTGDFIADESGSASIAAASALVPVSSLVGVSVDPASTGIFSGEDAESNAELVERCKLKLAALGPKVGPDGAYAFFAKSATNPTTEEGGGGLTLAGGPITRVAVITSLGTGVVQVYIANANGAPSGPDVTIINDWLHDVCVPDGVTENTFAAANASLAIAVTVSVTATYDTAATTTAVQLAVNEYLQTLPIGGIDIDGAGGLGVPYAGVLGAIMGLRSADGTKYIENVLSLTINAASASVSLSPTEVAVASPPVAVTRTVVV